MSDLFPLVRYLVEGYVTSEKIWISLGESVTSRALADAQQVCGPNRADLHRDGP